METAENMTTNDDFDFLTESGVKIKQAAGGYRFTSDAVHLANFVGCKHKDTVIDIGCGGGVISLIVNDRCRPEKILAVDIQPAAVELARENIALNNFDSIEAVEADIRTYYKVQSNFADVAVCNPPYFSTGIKSNSAAVRTARHDETLTLEDLAYAVTKLLKFGGAFYMCYPAKYTAKAIRILEQNNFRIRKLKFLKNEKEVYLVLIHAKKGNGDGCTVEFA